MSERVAPFHCPYCGEEDLRPHEAGHGTWECRACMRAFRLSFLGLLRPSPAGDSAGDSARDSAGDRDAPARRAP